MQTLRSEEYLLHLPLVSLHPPLNLPEVLSSTLRNMAHQSLQADLVEHCRLETYFGEASVNHTIYSHSIHKEEWRRGGAIGRGGFSAVHLEHGPKDSVRAVKVIDKRTLSPRLDLSRELSIMSFLTKVCLFSCLLVFLLGGVFLDLIA